MEPESHEKITLTTCSKRSVCALASTLDLIGDKWTLLVVRDMLFVGKKQFNDFLESPEGISTNILTDRLKRLEEYALIEKQPYQKNPLRYEYFLTERGQALKSILLTMAEWGINHIEGTYIPTEEELKTFRQQYE